MLHRHNISNHQWMKWKLAYNYKAIFEWKFLEGF